jgi:hypothetical protein
MTEFDVQVDCPACGASFSVARIRQGRAETCPVCRSPVKVPGAPAEGEERPREPARGHEEATAAVPAPWLAAGGVEVDVPSAPAAVPSGKCLVCLHDDARFDISEVSPVVDELDGLITLDTKLQLAQGMGILAKHIPQDVAEEMVARLSGVQVPAFAVDEALVPAVERQLPIIIVHSVADEAIYVQSDVHGTVESIPWPLVAGGFCTKEHVVRGGPTELQPESRMHWGGALSPPVEQTVYKAVPRPREPDIECTLLLRGRSGNLYSMRFTEKKVRYSYLSEGGEQRGGNRFSLFLTDILRCCPHGFFPGSMRAVAAGRRVKVAQLKRRDDYVRYREWVCACIAAGLQQRNQ